jgi:signal transduction histidine kinase
LKSNEEGWASTAGGTSAQPQIQPSAAILDGLPIGVFVTNERGRPVYANRFALDLLGHDLSSDLSLEALAEIYGAHRLPGGERYPLECMPITRALAGESCAVNDVELRFRSPPLQLQVWAAPLRDASGVVRFAISTFTPAHVAGQGASQSCAAGKSDQVKQAQRLAAIGEQVAGVAHEIYTPMQYIGDNTAFLGVTVRRLLELAASFERLLGQCRAEGALASHIARFEQELAAARLDYLRQQAPAAVAQSLEGVEQVREIVQALKEFSHPGEEQQSDVDLNHIARSAATITRGSWRHHAELELRLDSELRTVLGYPRDLARALINLIVNAAHAIDERSAEQKAAAAGRIVVATANRERCVELRVEDNGAGIPEAIRPRVLEPFFTTKRAGRGTGQGLSLVQSVVARHAGELSFSSDLGRGTTFFIRLPEKADG